MSKNIMCPIGSVHTCAKLGRVRCKGLTAIAHSRTSHCSKVSQHLFGKFWCHSAVFYCLPQQIVLGPENPRSSTFEAFVFCLECRYGDGESEEVTESSEVIHSSEADDPFLSS
jgi:hypothetical protein